MMSQEVVFQETGGLWESRSAEKDFMESDHRQVLKGDLEGTKYAVFGQVSS